MNSYALKGQKDAFALSCAKYHSSHNDIIGKLSEISSIISTCDDTVIVDYVEKTNQKIMTKIKRLDSNFTVVSGKVLAAVEKKILELEEQEKIKIKISK